MAVPPAEAPPADSPVVIPDAGPWITLAYADALELLAVPGWPVWMVDAGRQHAAASDI